MNYIKNIYQRIDLQQIGSFLLYGVENLDIENYTYKERLEKGNTSILARLESLYSEESDFDEAVADLSKALTTYEAVYTEIGMKAGTQKKR